MNKVGKNEINCAQTFGVNIGRKFGRYFVIKRKKTGVMFIFDVVSFPEGPYSGSQ